MVFRKGLNYENHQRDRENGKMTDALAKTIAKLEMHKGGTYTLNRAELRAVMAWLKDYLSLIRRLDGEWKSDEVDE